MSEVGILEGSFRIRPGRAYLIESSPILAAAAKRLGVHLRYTTDGSKPTIKSPKMMSAFAWGGGEVALTRLLRNDSGDEWTIRWLITANGPHVVPKPFRVTVRDLTQRPAEGAA